MNILILKPHSSYAAYGDMIPLGLAYVASALREDNHKIHLIDFSIIDSERERKQSIGDTIREFKESRGKWMRITKILEKTIKEFRPKVICISCNTSERFNMFKMVRLVKKMTKAIIIVGGPHVTVTAKQTLKKIREIDIIVRGEGEETIKELCKKIENEENWKDIRGISYISRGKVITNPNRELIQDLDKISFPARELFDNTKYSYSLPIMGLVSNVTGIVTSRGCPGKCHFCSGFVMWQGRFRFRSAKNVVDEMEDTLNKYPFYNGFWICDDNFFADNKRAINICREIKKRNLTFVWGCSGRADNITEEVAKEMSSAGCKLISFGIESGSNNVLKLMNKEIDIKTVKKAIKICRENGILPRGTFIFGYPGETLYDMLKTMRVIFNFEPATINYGTNVVFFPGTYITLKHIPDFDWCAPMPKNMPRIQATPLCVIPGDPMRAKILHKVMRILFLFYTATHPEYAIRIVTKRLSKKKTRF